MLCRRRTSSGQIDTLYPVWHSADGGIGLIKQIEKPSRTIRNVMDHWAQLYCSEQRQLSAVRINAEAGGREGWAPPRRVKGPAVRAHGHRQAGGRRQSGASDRHDLNQGEVSELPGWGCR
jgi:hypothetical protein